MCVRIMLPCHLTCFWLNLFMRSSALFSTECVALYKRLRDVGRALDSREIEGFLTFFDSGIPPSIFVVTRCELGSGRLDDARLGKRPDDQKQFGWVTIFLGHLFWQNSFSTEGLQSGAGFAVCQCVCNNVIGIILEQSKVHRIVLISRIPGLDFFALFPSLEVHWRV